MRLHKTQNASHAYIFFLLDPLDWTGRLTGLDCTCISYYEILEINFPQGWLANDTSLGDWLANNKLLLVQRVIFF